MLRQARGLLWATLSAFTADREFACNIYPDQHADDLPRQADSSSFEDIGVRRFLGPAPQTYLVWLIPNIQAGDAGILVRVVPIVPNLAGRRPQTDSPANAQTLDGDLASPVDAFDSALDGAAYSEFYARNVGFFYPVPSFGAGLRLEARVTSGVSGGSFQLGVTGVDAPPDDLLPRSLYLGARRDTDIDASENMIARPYCVPGYSRLRGSADCSQAYDVRVDWHFSSRNDLTGAYIDESDTEIIASGVASADTFFDVPLRSPMFSIYIRNTSAVANASGTWHAFVTRDS